MLIKQDMKKNAVLWSVTSLSMVDIYQHLAGPLQSHPRTQYFS